VTSAKRSQIFPDVPTVAESVPGYEAAGYFGFVTPTGTPRSVIALLHKEIVAGVLSPEMKERLINQGAEVIGSTPEAFGEFIRRDSNKWSKLLDELKIPKE
jgi:tripartite-type tricarboxylate transporter receptor subunit TctC